MQSAMPRSACRTTLGEHPLQVVQARQGTHATRVFVWSGHEPAQHLQSAGSHRELYLFGKEGYLHPRQSTLALVPRRVSHAQRTPVEQDKGLAHDTQAKFHNSK